MSPIVSNNQPEPTRPAGPQDKSLAVQAYERLRASIVQLEFAPGEVLREDELCDRLGIGRTPVREALQRLSRDHFVQVIPRRGMFVTGIDVSELSMLFETRSVLEPYAARLASARGNESHWEQMSNALERTQVADLEANELLAVDRICHELMWDAANNRFLLDTLDVLYAQSDRLWHLYLTDVPETDHAVIEHMEILEALRDGDGDRAAFLVESHVQAFDALVRRAVTARLESPLAS